MIYLDMCWPRKHCAGHTWGTPRSAKASWSEVQGEKEPITLLRMNSLAVGHEVLQASGKPFPWWCPNTPRTHTKAYLGFAQSQYICVRVRVCVWVCVCVFVRVCVCNISIDEKLSTFGFQGVRLISITLTCMMCLTYDEMHRKTAGRRGIRSDTTSNEAT